MNLPKKYISYSQIRLYQSCPKKYYYTYIEKIPVPISDKVLLGIVFHSTIAPCLIGLNLVKSGLFLAAIYVKLRFLILMEL